MPKSFDGATRPHGWSGSIGEFLGKKTSEIREALHASLPQVSREQVTAWTSSADILRKALATSERSPAQDSRASIVFEYRLPMEARRPDVVVLLPGVVLVLEFKSKSHPVDADLDQAHAYARDLRSYHSSCAECALVPVLVLTGAADHWSSIRGVVVVGRQKLANVIDDALREPNGSPISLEEFLAEDAYRPLPTLVKAARELFLTGTLRRIKRASAATDSAAQVASAIVHEAAKTKTRRLILVSGVPGAGKTLVGLRLVHENFMDDLSVVRADGQSSSPAVFLSGNGPLVQVLQHELRGAGGGGKVFVRGVKDYVSRYERKPKLIPPEHVVVFDEAQRAYDAAMVAEKHEIELSESKSEPAHIIEFANRIPDWCVVIGLIGSGQEIHKGEEAGIVQWASAIKETTNSNEWTVHAPPSLAAPFSDIHIRTEPALSLDVSLRSHLASDLHKFVAGLLAKSPMQPRILRGIAEKLQSDGHDLRITNNFEVAKQYLRSRYAENVEARFGILASSRDRLLKNFGVFNDFQSTKRVKYGPWYGDDETDEGALSCRHLATCVTEFGAQGLELDAAIVGWGSDFRLDGVNWSIERMAKYMKKGAVVRDPWQLRANAYRVLLTRARDASVVFVPDSPDMRETYVYLCESGFRQLN